MSSINNPINKRTHGRYIGLCVKLLQLSLLLFIIPLLGQSQSRRKELQKAWIKVETENLSEAPVEPDTLYTRYSFDKTNVHISFYPAWDQHIFQWSLEDPFLKIGFQTYVLEELTDSTLVFHAVKFRRLRFISEASYKQRQQPDTAESFNGHTLYIANKHLTPRYKKEQSLYDLITDRLSKVYDVKRESTFLARFIVTDQGKVERVQIINGINEDYNNEFIKQIKKTTGDWNPATIGNTPVYSEMTFEVKYLDSLDPGMGTISAEKS